MELQTAKSGSIALVQILLTKAVLSTYLSEAKEILDLLNILLP
jgi:hypothetical protein